MPHKSWAQVEVRCSFPCYRLIVSTTRTVVPYFLLVPLANNYSAVATPPAGRDNGDEQNNPDIRRGDRSVMLSDSEASLGPTRETPRCGSG